MAHINEGLSQHEFRPNSSCRKCPQKSLSWHLKVIASPAPLATRFQCWASSVMYHLWRVACYLLKYGRTANLAPCGAQSIWECISNTCDFPFRLCCMFGLCPMLLSLLLSRKSTESRESFCDMETEKFQQNTKSKPLLRNLKGPEGSWRVLGPEGSSWNQSNESQRSASPSGTAAWLKMSLMLQTEGRRRLARGGDWARKEDHG